jgi:hypothetical protein
MEPVDVQVVAYAPTGFYHCQHCELTFQQVGLGRKVHGDQLREGLPEDLQVQFHAVCDWVGGLAARYGSLVRLRVTDAASLEGFWKSLRYGVRSYPAIIVARREKYVGADFGGAEAAVERHVSHARVIEEGDA